MIERGQGTTTRQMQEAPIGSVFVWCNSHLHYPIELARHLERADLQIVSPDYLYRERFRGSRLKGLVIDHYLYVPLKLRPYIEEAMLHVLVEAGNG